jgi:hypothetical protein
LCACFNGTANPLEVEGSSIQIFVFDSTSRVAEEPQGAMDKTGHQGKEANIPVD